MLCDVCKKRPATIKFKEVLPDATTELNLCDECAAKRGLLSPKQLSPLETLQKVLRQGTEHDEGVICPRCCMSLVDFKRAGRFGCSDCPATFADHIQHLIKQIHHSDRHIGRRPAPGAKRGLEVYRLREELKRALAKELYEDAARIRDKLREYGVKDV